MPRSRLSVPRLAGNATLVTNIACPVGHAVALRVARDCSSLAFVTPDPDAEHTVLAEVRRTRALRSFETDPLFITSGMTTDAEVRTVAEQVHAELGPLDTLVVTGEIPVRHDGDGMTVVSLNAFVPTIRMARLLLGEQGEANIVLAGVLASAWPGALGTTAQQEALGSVRAFVHAAATVLSPTISVNGVVLEDPTQADAVLGFAMDPSLAAVREDRQRRSHLFHDAAQTVCFLASSEARGLSGQTLCLLEGDMSSTSSHVADGEVATYTALFDSSRPLRT